MFNHLQPNFGLTKGLVPGGVNQTSFVGQPMSGGLQGGSTFVELFIQQLQAANMAANPAAQPMGPTAAFMGLPPGQITSAGGQSLPLFGGQQPLMIETFSYSRVSFLPGHGAAAPSEELASLLKSLEAPQQPALEHAAGLGAMGAGEIAVASPELPKATADPINDGRTALAHSAVLAPVTDLAADADPELSKTTSPATAIASISLKEIGEKIGEKVINLAEQDVPKVEAAIEHPEFGRIEAEVEIEGSNVTLSFGAENAEVRNALESAQGEIEAILAESGFVLAGMDISDIQDSTEAPGILAPQAGEQLAHSPQLDNLLLESLGGGPLSLIQA